MKRFLLIVLSIAILLTTLLITPIASYAATPVELEDSSLGFWADPENVLSQDAISNFSSDKLATLGGVKAYRISTSNIGLLGGDRKYYLFLPTNADCTALKLWFSGTLYIDNKSISSGVPTDVFKDVDEGGITKTYRIRTGNTLTYNELVVIKSGDVGTVYIDTESGSMKDICGSRDHSVEETGSVMVVDKDGNVDYSGALERIAGHGNGSWSTNYDKLAYNIKLATSTGLLGMGKAKKWILLANKNDQTLVKNRITYDFSRLIGIEYEPYVKPIDLYVNQQYFGSYLLCEKVELKSNRVGLKSDAYENLEIANGSIDPISGKLVSADLTGTEIFNDNVGKGDTQGGKRYAPSLKDPTDVTGGYLYELDIAERWIKDGTGFSGYNRQGWSVKNCDYASKGMVDYSYDLLFALGSAVYNNGIVPSNAVTEKYDFGDTNNPAPNEKYQGLKWSDILDSSSAIKYYWVMEYFKNMDSSLSSTYFYKESDSIDSKLYAGPVWDMDWSICYGRNSSRWGYSYSSTDGWYTKNTGLFEYSMSKTSTSYKANVEVPRSFYGALATNCADFWIDAERYWNSYIDQYIDILLGNRVDETGTLKSVKEYVYELKKSGTMNNIRFDINNGSYSRTDIVSGLTNWLSSRRDWINSQISTFDINSAVIDQIVSYSYTGSEVEVKPYLSYDFPNVGKIDLVENVDYTLTYENNVNAGIATVIVNGIGKFTGKMERAFEISPVDLSKCSVEIDSKAYDNTKLVAKVLNKNNELNTSISYQWYKDNLPIENEINDYYIVSENDIDSIITVEIKGDEVNTTGTITSNECVVRAGERPEGFSQTLAEWEYNYPNDITSISETDYIYQATDGNLMSISTMTASVNAVDNAKLKWSGSADIYVNELLEPIENQTPIISTSKTDNLAWGEYPYFEFKTSTLGFDNVKISASLGGSKKAPRDWNISYSLDGVEFIEVENSKYTILDNKVLEKAYDSFALPQECENQDELFIRISACEDMAINNLNSIVGSVSGDASINNVSICASSMEIVEALLAPSFNIQNGKSIYNDTKIEILDNNGGADLYYSINDSEPVKYENAITLFDNDNKYGDYVTISAFAKFNDVVSDDATRIYYFAGNNIQSFCYDKQPLNVFNGEVSSTSGTYGTCGKMSSTADEIHQYVPLWNEKTKSFSVSPDDGTLWSEVSGFTYRLTTAGFENLKLSLDAYTTNQGPKSITIQYSINGIDFYNVESNIELELHAELNRAVDSISLPSACNNQQTLFIRIATTENSTFLGDKLHNNLSKGNLYVNNFILAGEDDGSLKMPYTEKSTSYFGLTGSIDYISPDDLPISYAVFDELNEIVQSGIMNDNSIQLASLPYFNNKEQAKYTLITWVEDDEDTSLSNIKNYYYKGETVTKFNYNSTSKLFANYVDEDLMFVNNTSGEKTGSLSMFPNGVSQAILSYTDTYGVKVAWNEFNPFVSSKKLDNPKNNGFWLIETSSTGYTDLSINLEQLSSNKGPRDWGIAYSLDNDTFKYVSNSNIRAVSNDASTSTVETYNNFKLPNECDNQDKLFIKIFINGGESVDETELEEVLKGNIGINSIEINGIQIPNKYSLKIKTVSQINKHGETNNESVQSNIKINNSLVSNKNGEYTIDVIEGKRYKIQASVGNTFVNEKNVVINSDSEIVIPVVTVEYVEDGIINAKDYGYIIKHFSNEEQNKNKDLFKSLVNLKQ